MFAAPMNLDALRVCAAVGCGRPLPVERQGEEFCSDACREREEERRTKADKASG